MPVRDSWHEVGWPSPRRHRLRCGYRLQRHPVVCAPARIVLLAIRHLRAAWSPPGAELFFQPHWQWHRISPSSHESGRHCAQCARSARQGRATTPAPRPLARAHGANRPPRLRIPARVLAGREARNAPHECAKRHPQQAPAHLWVWFRCHPGRRHPPASAQAGSDTGVERTRRHNHQHAAEMTCSGQADGKYSCAIIDSNRTLATCYRPIRERHEAIFPIQQTPAPTDQIHQREYKQKGCEEYENRGKEPGRPDDSPCQNDIRQQRDRFSGCTLRSYVLDPKPRLLQPITKSVHCGTLIVMWFIMQGIKTWHVHEEPSPLFEDSCDLAQTCPWLQQMLKHIEQRDNVEYI